MAKKDLSKSDIPLIQVRPGLYTVKECSSIFVKLFVKPKS